MFVNSSNPTQRMLHSHSASQFIQGIQRLRVEWKGEEGDKCARVRRDEDPTAHAQPEGHDHAKRPEVRVLVLNKESLVLCQWDATGRLYRLAKRLLGQLVELWILRVNQKVGVL